MARITLNIDGQEVRTRKGKSVLEAALDAGLYIPNLCYHPDLSPLGACRLCVVEIKDMRGIPTACTTQAEDGMVVKTKTAELEQIRRVSMELMLSGHPGDCVTCPQNLNCELQAVAQYLGISELRLRSLPRDFPVNTTNPLFDHDLNRCILCGRCVRACYELRGVGILSFIKRGRETYIGTAFDRSLADAGCVFCGACVEVCPTGAIRDKDGLLAVGADREATLVPCKHACPAGVDAPRYIRLIGEGKYGEAVAVIREKVPFPEVLGRVCNHPCETVCRRKELNEAIAIRALKRFAGERDNKLWQSNSKQAAPTGQKVAIIGSGPAGLTAAYYLTKLGYSVTVFEALPVVGGMMRVAIPEFRLPAAVRDAEIDEIRRIGFEVQTNSRIESLDALFRQGYQAIFVAVGAHKGTSMRAEGEDSPGVIDAIDFLREVSLGKEVKLGDRVAVIGGGNVAIDAARTALRLEAKEVTIIYRRTRAEMPALPEEVEGALAEEIKIDYLAAPKRMWAENGVIKMECIRMELGEPDASGRRRPVPLEGSEFVTDYDTVIAAIGQVPVVPPEFKVETEWGNIKVKNEVVTSQKGVFAGGDCVTGPATVIEAIAAGRKAAIAIDKYLGGKGIIDEILAPVEEPEACLGHGDGFAYQRLGEMRHLPTDRRLNNFDEVELGYEEATGRRESLRCLKCDLRLKISRVKFPPKRETTKGN